LRDLQDRLEAEMQHTQDEQDERARQTIEHASLVSTLHEQIDSLRVQHEHEHAEAQRAIFELRAALAGAQEDAAQSGLVARELEGRVAALQEEVQRGAEEFANLAPARVLHNEVASELDALRHARKERLDKEISFLDSYKQDLVGADARVHEVLQENRELAARLADTERTVFDAREDAAALRQALAQHSNTAQASHGLLTHEVKKLGYIILLSTMMLKRYLIARSFAGWHARTVYRRKVASALSISRAVHARCVQAHAFRQLLRAFVRRRHFRAVSGAIRKLSVARASLRGWFLLGKDAQVHRLGCHRVLQRAVLVDRRRMRAVLRAWFQHALHATAFALYAWSKSGGGSSRRKRAGRSGISGAAKMDLRKCRSQLFEDYLLVSARTAISPADVRHVGPSEQVSRLISLTCVAHLNGSSP
jgi:hypothetical protein